jgi:thiol-disulfide isomerase/thioredoxin
MRPTFARLPMITALLLLLAVAPAARAGGDWNDANVAWKSYDDGVALAKKEKKPICLVFYTEWCPHCANYSGVFHDPKVVDTSKKFVMVRLDKDKNADLSKKYAPDGEYIPRTYFLQPDGTLVADIKTSRPKYVYFYDEKNPSDVLGAMEVALQKIK